MGGGGGGNNNSSFSQARGDEGLIKVHVGAVGIPPGEGQQHDLGVKRGEEDSIVLVHKGAPRVVVVVLGKQHTPNVSVATAGLVDIDVADCKAHPAASIVALL